MLFSPDALKELDDIPPALKNAADEVIPYIKEMTKVSETPAKLFGKVLIPYPKTQEEFWWTALMSCKPATNIYSGDMPFISAVSENELQTPQAEVRLLGPEKLKDASLDVEFIMNDDCGSRTLTAVQVNPTSNFLEKTVYKQVKLEEWKFARYLMQHRLCLHRSEVPKFLGYNINVFGYPATKCVELEHKVHLRNTPANLLIIDKKTLTSPVDIHGKVFVVAEDRDLTPDELKEIVIFCMGQAETNEFKYTSWERLKEKLQDEARKFAMSAQHLTPPKRS
jgi:hypothetical protein